MRRQSEGKSSATKPSRTLLSVKRDSGNLLRRSTERADRLESRKVMLAEGETGADSVLLLAPTERLRPLLRKACEARRKSPISDLLRMSLFDKGGTAY